MGCPWSEPWRSLRRVSASRGLGSLIHPRSSLHPLAEVLRERGPGWVSSPLPGLWFSPGEGPGSEVTRSGRRENPESLSRSIGEVPLFGSKIDSWTNLMGDVPVPPPPQLRPFLFWTSALLSENERQGEKHFRSFPMGLRLCSHQSSSALSTLPEDSFLPQTGAGLSAPVVPGGGKV